MKTNSIIQIPALYSHFFYRREQGKNVEICLRSSEDIDLKNWDTRRQRKQNESYVMGFFSPLKKKTDVTDVLFSKLSTFTFYSFFLWLWLKLTQSDRYMSQNGMSTCCDFLDTTATKCIHFLFLWVYGWILFCYRKHSVSPLCLTIKL